MTTLHWHELRRRAIDGFNGELPAGPTEQAIIDLFELEPRAVRRALDDVIHNFQKGGITYGWKVWLHRIQNAQTGRDPEVVVDDRDAEIAKAEAWIRNAGLYLDEPDVIRELFGHREHTPDLEMLQELERKTRDSPGRAVYGKLLEKAIERTAREGPQPIPDSHGPLARWDTPQLRERILTLWREHRPRGLHAEAESVAYQTEAGEWYRKIRQHVTHAGGQHEADAHAARVAREIDRAKRATEAPDLAYLDQIAPEPDQVEAVA